MHHLRKFLIFFILLLFIQFSSGRDTLSTGQTLEGDGLLISSNETFALGFFSPDGMPKNRYIGIWYYKVSEKKVVWVANRENPVNHTSGVLSFHKSKNLVIYGPDLKTPIWSTNFLGQGKNYSAQLLDTGNLVVFEENKKGVIAWQSFDHPTDTWLPKMKLGMNRKTGLSWFLTSWASFDDPATGKYSLRMDSIHELSELCLYEGPDRIWRTGPLNGGPQLTSDKSLDYILSYTYVDDEDEVSLMYGMFNPGVYSVMVVNNYGAAVRMMSIPSSRQWQLLWMAPNTLCDEYGMCGSNSNCYAPNTTAPKNDCFCLPGSEPKSPRDWNSEKKLGAGCVRKRDRNDCQNGEGFIKLSVTQMPDTTTARVDRVRVVSKECEEECLKDCNCTAHANVPEMKSACVMWYGDLMDIKQYGIGGVELYVRTDTSQDGNKQQYYSSSKKQRTVAAVVTSVSVVAGLIAISIFCWRTHKRKGLRSRAEQILYGPNNSAPSQTSLTEQSDEGQTSAVVPFFDLRTLAEATNRFSDNNKLGEGGFGSVYKGILKNGQEIAVKRLSDDSRQGAVEFKNEATLIAKLQHRNLVKLLGYCAQGEEKMLIYEFLPNKSLDSLIFDKAKSARLNWAQRFSIIMGITRGMIYLHEDSRLKIIHRDLKASNVLLDAEMVPKISDFGMARPFVGDQDEANTNKIVGTYGYMSPEYAMDGLYSVKSDVYSFGVLILEIISGRKNNSFYHGRCLNLIARVWRLWREDRVLEIVDSMLYAYSAKEALRCIHVGLLSVEEQAVDRPTMSEIALMLSNGIALPPPKQPAFIIRNYDGKYTSSTNFGWLSGSQYTSSSSDGSLSGSQYTSSSSGGPLSGSQYTSDGSVPDEFTVSVIEPR